MFKKLMVEVLRMKAIACEMCGSNDIIKQEGIYVCQHCGTKYTVEEQRKALTGKRIDDHGSTIRLDVSDDIRNLYQLARRAKNKSDAENAARYYEMILLKDTDSWEAVFYYEYFRLMVCKVCDIDTAVPKFSSNLSTVFSLISENVLDDEEQVNAINSVIEDSMYLAILLYSSEKNNFNSIDSDEKYNYLPEMLLRCGNARNILYILGDNIELNFSDNKFLMDKAVEAWKEGVEQHNEMHHCSNLDVNIALAKHYITKIRKFDNSYLVPKKKSQGCYIATCVYGSYDCPEVCVLRRFRDEVLDRTFFGKFFINVYYFVSPKVVKIFGENKVFRSICRKSLDNLINVLKKKGFDDTPYKDLY